MLNEQDKTRQQTFNYSNMHKTIYEKLDDKIALWKMKIPKKYRQYAIYIQNAEHILTMLSQEHNENEYTDDIKFLLKLK